VPQLVRALLVCTCLAAPSAWAWDVCVNVTLRVTFEMTSDVTSDLSSKASSASSRGGSHPAQVKQGPDGSACIDHDDCRGWCQGGMCVGSQPSPPPGPPGCQVDAQCGETMLCRDGVCVLPAPPPGCQSDAQCGPGVLCRNGLCVLPDAPPAGNPAPGAPPAGSPASPSACTADVQCPAGQVCTNGRCAPPPPPAILRKGIEHLLRDRVAQLQEDLVFGRGPVINALASAQGVSARALGETLRAHRAELSVLVGDGRDEAWTDRFLRRVEALSRACPGA
jgi:Cys-rich repeat protein